MGEAWWLLPAFFVVALLYASVGHGGASGYLALFSLVGLHPDAMATTALTLNICVACLTLVSFARAGHLRGRLAWPFLVTSVPMAFVGGAAPMPARLYTLLLAAALLVAAWRLVVDVSGRTDPTVRSPSVSVALPVGGAIGWLSGAIGIGGGIFLSPLLLMLRWATPKQAAAASAAFILVNSVAGLGGRAVREGLVYGPFWPLLFAALAGGLVGARLGANHFSGRTLKRLLAVVLLVAVGKLVISVLEATG